MKSGLFPEYIENNQNNYKYDSLDISWLYIRAVKEYINESQDYNFLKENIYLLNNLENVELNYLKMKDKNQKNVLSLENIIQLIFQFYAQGIKFIDKNKNNLSSPKKKEKAKNIKIKKKNDNYSINTILDNHTGFIFKKNINVFDKNSKAKLNLGFTTDIELISLLYDCINFVILINNNNYYPYKEVVLSNNDKLSFYQWSMLIKKSFEKEFISEDGIFKTNITNKYIDSNKEKSNNEYKNKKEEAIINKKKENESKLNPNILLAIYYSPDLFTKETIILAIDFIEKYFLNEEIGFLNSENSQNKLKGIRVFDKSYNYQEFPHLYGIYLIVKIKYFYNIDNLYENIDEIIRYISKKLYPYIQNMKESVYFGIPEIIDEDGKVGDEGHKSDLKSFAIFYELINIISYVYMKTNKLKENNEELMSKNN